MHLGNKGGRLLLQLGNCLQYILVHLINATRSCLDKEVLSAGEECIMHFYSNVGIKYALVRGVAVWWSFRLGKYLEFMKIYIVSIVSVMAQHYYLHKET